MKLRTPSVRHDLLVHPHLAAFVFAAVVAVFAASPEAHAARGRARGGAAAPHGKTKVGVVTFTGPGEAASRAAVTKALTSKKIVVVPGAELVATAKQLHVRLEDDSGFKAVAKSLSLTAFVQGEVARKKATLTVRTGQDGSVVGEESFTGPDPKHVAGVVGKTFWKRLAGAFNKTNPPSGGRDAADEAPPAAAAEPEAETPPAARETARPAREEVAAAEPERKPRKQADAESEEGGRAPKRKAAGSEDGEKKRERPASKSEETDSEASESPWFDGALGLADLLRSLSYNQLRNDLGSQKVANYSLPTAPIIVGKFDFFPGAMLGMGGIVEDIGLALDLSYLLPVVTTPGEGGSYKTASLAWAVGPKLRLPAGIFATVAYGDHWFKLLKSNSSMNPSSTVPATDYKYVRLGAGIRRQVTSSLSLMANLAYDRCLGAPGQIGGSAYFPKTTCAALELGVAAGYRITDSVELRGGVDLQRFGLAFHNTPASVDGTHPIAGGAVDQYIQIYAAVAYLIGGGGSSSGGDAESAPDDDAGSHKEKKAAKDDKDDKDDDKDDGDDKDDDK